MITYWQKNGLKCKNTSDLCYNAFIQIHQLRNTTIPIRNKGDLMLPKSLTEAKKDEIVGNCYYFIPPSSLAQSVQ
jgi:hypothetical protein